MGGWGVLRGRPSLPPPPPSAHRPSDRNDRVLYGVCSTPTRRTENDYDYDYELRFRVAMQISCHGHAPTEHSHRSYVHELGAQARLATTEDST